MQCIVYLDKPCRNGLVDDLLDVDKYECLGKKRKVKTFLAFVDESIGERESMKFMEGLSSATQVLLKVYFLPKCYIEGLTLLLTLDRTHGLNEELGRCR